MRTMELQQKEMERADKTARWRYALLVDDIVADGFCCESYGLRIIDTRTGEQTEARHITVNATAALTLLEQAARLEVSPAALADVVEDFLAAL